MKKYTTFFILALWIPQSYSQGLPNVGSWISGDFNGNGKLDTAFIRQGINTTTQTGTWEIFFSDASIPGIPLNYCRPILINEGDLDQNKTVEFSVFQEPESGCIYSCSTYSYHAGKWVALIPGFLIPTRCDHFNARALERRVFRKNGKIYYWDMETKDGKSKPVRRMVSHGIP